MSDTISGTLPNPKKITGVISKPQTLTGEIKNYNGLGGVLSKVHPVNPDDVKSFVVVDELPLEPKSNIFYILREDAP